MKLILDKECISLVKALNSIRGIQTRESCCGHAEESFYVIFLCKIKKLESLIYLLKSIDNKYWENMKSRGFKNWNCSVVSPEKIDCPILFKLDSGSLVGPRAYKQADKIADGIRKLWAEHRDSGYLPKWKEKK
jgi:hypothetical protein